LISDLFFTGVDPFTFTLEETVGSLEKEAEVEGVILLRDELINGDLFLLSFWFRVDNEDDEEEDDEERDDERDDDLVVLSFFWRGLLISFLFELIFIFCS